MNKGRSLPFEIVLYVYLFFILCLIKKSFTLRFVQVFPSIGRQEVFHVGHLEHVHEGTEPSPKKGDEISETDGLFSGVGELLDGNVDGQIICPQADDMVCPRPEVTFWLYTRETRDNPIKLDPLLPIPQEPPGFIVGAPLRVLVHGFTDNKDRTINRIMRPAYFSRGEYNIISVDWSPLVQIECYIQAAHSVPTVGHCVALTVAKVLELHARKFPSVQLIGHSLGAHVVAWASNELDLKRVTEFDPALPLFTNYDELLKRAKATMVDVWHTNSGFFGRQSNDGTVDLFLNDGTDQPGCNCDISCSHRRSVEYYAETVARGIPLTAFPCEGGWDGYKNDKCPKPDPEDLADFGEDFFLRRNGTFLAFTNFDSPYIIPGSQYLNEATYQSFRETRDMICPVDDATSYLAEFLNL